MLTMAVMAFGCESNPAVIASSALYSTGDFLVTVQTIGPGHTAKNIMATSTIIIVVILRMDLGEGFNPVSYGWTDQRT